MLAYWTFSPVKDASLRGTPMTNRSASQQQPTPPTRPVVASSDPVRGDAAAPLAIVEFGDFFCPACAEVEVTLRKVLDDNPGKVKLVWKDLPNTRLHPLAQKAAEAARCAGAQGKFWQYHDALLKQTDQGQSLSEQGLSLIARDLNLNMEAFGECLTTGQTADLVERSFNEALLLRVDATPYFFIGERRFSGAVSEQELKSLIDSALK